MCARDCPNFCYSLFLPVFATRKRGPTSLCWEKHGLMQLSDYDTVCSPFVFFFFFFLCLQYFVVACRLVCIISIRPTSLCIPMTRRLLCYCFSSYHNAVDSSDKIKTEEQKQDCQLGCHPPTVGYVSSKCSLKLVCLMKTQAIHRSDVCLKDVSFVMDQ